MVKGPCFEFHTLVNSFIDLWTFDTFKTKFETLCVSSKPCLTHAIYYHTNNQTKISLFAFPSILPKLLTQASFFLSSVPNKFCEMCEIWNVTSCPSGASFHSLASSRCCISLHWPTCGVGVHDALSHMGLLHMWINMMVTYKCLLK